jgi:hypothetical protein
MKPTTEAIWKDFAKLSGQIHSTRVADSATAEDILQASS